MKNYSKEGEEKEDYFGEREVGCRLEGYSSHYKDHQNFNDLKARLEKGLLDL